MTVISKKTLLIKPFPYNDKLADNQKIIRHEIGRKENAYAANIPANVVPGLIAGSPLEDRTIPGFEGVDLSFLLELMREIDGTREIRLSSLMNLFFRGESLSPSDPRNRNTIRDVIVFLRNFWGSVGKKLDPLPDGLTRQVIAKDPELSENEKAQKLIEAVNHLRETGFKVGYESALRYLAMVDTHFYDSYKILSGTISKPANKSLLEADLRVHRLRHEIQTVRAISEMLAYVPNTPEIKKINGFAREFYRLLDEKLPGLTYPENVAQTDTKALLTNYKLLSLTSTMPAINDIRDGVRRKTGIDLGYPKATENLVEWDEERAPGCLTIQTGRDESWILRPGIFQDGSSLKGGSQEEQEEIVSIPVYAPSTGPAFPPSKFDRPKETVDLNKIKFEAESTDSNESLANEISEWLKIAKDYAKLKDYQNTKDSIEEALKLDKENPEAYSFLGQVEEANHNFELAEENYRRACEIAPDDVNHLFLLASLYGTQERYEDALYLLTKATENSPSNPSAWSNYAKALVAVERKQEAIDAYNRAIELDKENFCEWRELVSLYSDFKDADNTLKALLQSIKKDRLDLEELASSNLLIARLYEVKGSVEKAQTHLKNALDLSEVVANADDKATLFGSAATIYKNIGFYDKAIELFNKAIALNRQDASLHDHLGQSYLAQKNYREAVRSYERAIGYSDLPTYVQYSDLGIAYQANKQYKKAVDSFQKALEINPQQSDKIKDHENLGFCYWKLDKFEEAAEQYKEVFKLEPENKQALTNMFIFYHNANKLDRAANFLESFVQENPENAEAHFTLARVYYHQKRPSLAHSSAKKALELEPNNSEYALKAANFYVKEKNYLEAHKILLRAMLNIPNDAEITGQFGANWLKLGRIQEAVKHLEKSIELNPQSDSVNEYRFDLGNAYIKNESWQQALEQFQIVEKNLGGNNDDYSKNAVKQCQQKIKLCQQSLSVTSSNNETPKNLLLPEVLREGNHLQEVNSDLFHGSFEKLEGTALSKTPIYNLFNLCQSERNDLLKGVIGSSKGSGRERLEKLKELGIQQDEIIKEIKSTFHIKDEKELLTWEVLRYKVPDEASVISQYIREELQKGNPTLNNLINPDELIEVTAFKSFLKAIIKSEVTTGKNVPRKQLITYSEKGTETEVAGLHVGTLMDHLENDNFYFLCLLIDKANCELMWDAHIHGLINPPAKTKATTANEGFGLNTSRKKSYKEVCTSINAVGKNKKKVDKVREELNQTALPTPVLDVLLEEDPQKLYKEYKGTSKIQPFFLINPKSNPSSTLLITYEQMENYLTKVLGTDFLAEAKETKIADTNPFSSVESEDPGQNTKAAGNLFTNALVGVSNTARAGMDRLNELVSLGNFKSAASKEDWITAKKEFDKIFRGDHVLMHNAKASELAFENQTEIIKLNTYRSNMMRVLMFNAIRDNNHELANKLIDYTLGISPQAEPLHIVYSDISQACRILGRREDAIKYLRKVDELKPGFVDKEASDLDPDGSLRKIIRDSSNDS
ncbi:MAG: tetratricopeptide repeat protein [Candidatus Caenarcaniphilales bacterium]|nr:tetratricopeptide repeat protein [Candidatus Caenarcaniphilales bacterium]